MEPTTTNEKAASGIANTLLVVAIIGAINWGLIGFFNFNLVDAIFGGGAREVTSGFSRVIYALVGLCGVASAFFLPRLRVLTRGRGEAGFRRRAQV